MNNRDIDDAIDGAVREMMNVDSSPATRARVLASLERPERRQVRWMWAAAAATAVLVLAILVIRAPRHETPPGLVMAPDGGAPHLSPPNGPPPTPSDSEQASRAAPPVMRRTPERTVAGTVAPELPETIPALAEIDPLVVPPPRARDIEPEEVVIPPLSAIPEIEFDPLPFPPGLRD